MTSANEAASELVKQHLNEKKDSLKKQLVQKQNLIELKKSIWPSYIIDEMKSDSNQLQERITDIDNLLHSEDAKNRQRFQQMRKRKANQLIEQQHVKRRKIGQQGAPRKLDEEDEEFLAKCVEDKATYHGRRQNLVMYTNRRVKSRDLLNIANHRLQKAGKKLIKSASTVYNRCKPKNSRSMQASRHIGKGLMCFKKPPKAEDKDNENTHYQRAHVKNIKMSMFSEESGEAKDYSLLHSIDDKAYIRPGTSEGFSSARNQRILTLSDATKAKKLPKYDWPEKYVYQTPGSHRVMTKESVKDKDGCEKLINAIDHHTVFVRPKALVGSSGTVWASEMVQLRQENPRIFQVDEDKLESARYTESFTTCCSMIHDYSYQYYDMTTDEDLEKLMADVQNATQRYAEYEHQRLRRLNDKLKSTLGNMEEMENDFAVQEKTLFDARIRPAVESILSKCNDISDDINIAPLKELCLQQKELCLTVLRIIEDCKFPPVKPRVAYLTDAGPGVGVSNFEVKFRDAELARMYSSDYRVRVHRSRGDSGQGEAERTNSAIADSIVDGATIEWETIKRYDDMTDEEVSMMSVKEFEYYEKERMAKNAWIVANELVKRIDGAPVLGEYINAKLSVTMDQLFFFNKDLLIEYQNSTTEEKKKAVPGSGYIEKILLFLKQHYRMGELFMEYIKHACTKEKDSTCEYCASHAWIGPPAKRIPQPKPDEDNPGHYMPVSVTPLYDSDGNMREVDDYQPRVFITSLFNKGEISLDDKEVVEETATKLAIDEVCVVSCVDHLKGLSINKERRERTKAVNKEKKINAKYEDYDWLELVISGKINGLLVLELDKYLDRHNLHKKCSKKDKVRAVTADVLRKQASDNINRVIKESSHRNEEVPDVEDEENDITNSDDDVDDDSDNDLVFDDFDDENNEKIEEQDSWFNDNLVVATRSGRQAGSWRLAFME